MGEVVARRGSEAREGRRERKSSKFFSFSPSNDQAHASSSARFFDPLEPFNRFQNHSARSHVPSKSQAGAETCGERRRGPKGRGIASGRQRRRGSSSCSCERRRSGRRRGGLALTAWRHAWRVVRALRWPLSLARASRAAPSERREESLCSEQRRCSFL